MPLSELTPEQANAIRTIAGDDPERQRGAIAKLAPTWATPKTPTEILAEARTLNPFYHAEYLADRERAAQAQPLPVRLAAARAAHEVKK